MIDIYDMTLNEIIERVAKSGKSDTATNVCADDNGFVCGNCNWGDYGMFSTYRPNYCPNCGAEMVTNKVMFSRFREGGSLYNC